MDTSDGGKAGRSNSVSHSKPVSHRRVDSTSCRITGDAIEGAAPSTNVPATTAPAQPTALRAGAVSPEACAYTMETTPLETKVRTPSRKRVRESKHHKPRQRSHHDIRSSPSRPNTPVRKEQLSDMEIEHQLYEVLDQATTVANVDLVDPFMKASMFPPITHESLSELDIARIINNPKLRHDVNFDRELHFRPNLDGSRGRHKLRAADEYWKALIGELVLYKACGTHLSTCGNHLQMQHWVRMMTASQKRLPAMFETIREVIKTLVPERDQPTVAERLDVSMIMQQILRGVFDLMNLANWLARLLKAHCAPMRDEWIDQMVAAVQKGVDEGCQKRIVIGLRQLMGILEAMKLDVANHQIRHLRGLLIDDAVNFQQRYHMHRLNYGRFDTPRARRWFDREQAQLSSSHEPIGVFASALLRSLLSQSPNSAFPETFTLDSERLRSMRHDLHHNIFLATCCSVFDLLVSSPISEEQREAAHAALRPTLAAIAGESRRYVEASPNLAVEVVRAVAHVDGTDLDPDLIELAEQRLRADLPASSLAFAACSKALRDEYLPYLQIKIKANLKLAPTALHEAMVPPAVALAAPFGLQKAKPTDKRGMESVLNRLTHVGVLHWHIWSEMIYLNDPSTPLLQKAVSATSDAGTDMTAHEVSTPMTIDTEMTDSCSEDSESGIPTPETSDEDEEL